MRRAVVLGGTGFLGRHMCGALAEGGYEVVALARRRAEVPRTRMVQADLAGVSAEELAERLAELGPELVVNAAGALWGPLSEEQLRRSNVDAVRTVLEALARLESRPRLVHFGTVHEYGDTEAGVRLTEKTPCRPVAPYGQTKLAATGLVLAAAETGAVDAVVLRLANVLGPGIPEHSLPGKVASALAAARGGRARLELRLTPSARDYFDVRDMTAAVLAAAKAPVSGQLLTVGSGTAVRAADIVDDLIRISGVPTDLVEQTAGDAGPMRSASGWQEVDPGAAATVLGWKARHDVAAALRTVWEAVASGA